MANSSFTPPPLTGTTPDNSNGYPVYVSSNNGTIANMEYPLNGQVFAFMVQDSNTSIQLGTNIKGMGNSVGSVQLYPGDMCLMGYANTGGVATWHYLGPSTALQAGRNRLINGEMRIDQRNSGNSNTVTFTANLVPPPANSTYVVDRWVVSSTGANVIAQQTGGPGGVPWKNGLSVFGAANVTGTAITQRIETINSLDLANQPVTISAYATISTPANLTVTAYVPVTSNDTWGGTATDVAIANANWAANSTLTRFTFTVPASNTSNANKGLAVTFSTGALGAGNILQLTGVQVEAGSSATVFERRPDDQELLRCQRYLPCWSYSSGTGDSIGSWICQAGNSTTVVFPVIFPAPTRISPTSNAQVGSLGGTISYANMVAVGNTSNIVYSMNVSAYTGKTSAILGAANITGLTANTVYNIQMTALTQQSAFFLTGCEL